MAALISSSGKRGRGSEFPALSGLPCLGPLGGGLTVPPLSSPRPQAAPLLSEGPAMCPPHRTVCSPWTSEDIPWCLSSESQGQEWEWEGLAFIPGPLVSVPAGGASPCSDSSRSGSFLPLCLQNHLLSFHRNVLPTWWRPGAPLCPQGLEPAREGTADMRRQGNPPASLCVETAAALGPRWLHGGCIALGGPEGI